MTETNPRPLLVSDEPVMLVGAGPVTGEDLRHCAQLCGAIVAADGGAMRLLDEGLVPDAVIGDMDSLTGSAQAQLAPQSLHPVSEQDSTDFEKCLVRIDAPIVLGLGFTGGRVDHLLAVLNGLIRHPSRRCLLIGPDDVGVVLPPNIALPLREGAAISLFPMAPVAVESSGLKWPIKGLPFRPDGQIGTSNRTTGPVQLRADGSGMLLFLPRAHLDLLLAACATAPSW